MRSTHATAPLCPFTSSSSAMFAQREEERAALSRHAGVLWQMGFRSRKKAEHVSRKETSRGSVNICVSHLGTNLGRHKIGTRQQGLQSPPGNSTVMGIIRNNFSHTGYNARREGSHRGKWVNHDETEAKVTPTPAADVLKWVNRQRRGQRRKAKSWN